MTAVRSVDEPAFPRTGYWTENGPHEADADSQVGMTLRDYFAAKALVGFTANRETYLAIVHDGRGMHPDDAVARSCYSLADAMLKARSESPS